LVVAFGVRRGFGGIVRADAAEGALVRPIAEAGIDEHLVVRLQGPLGEDFALRLFLVGHASEIVLTIGRVLGDRHPRRVPERAVLNDRAAHTERADVTVDGARYLRNLIVDQRLLVVDERLRPEFDTTDAADVVRARLRHRVGDEA